MSATNKGKSRAGERDRKSGRVRNECSTVHPPVLAVLAYVGGDRPLHLCAYIEILWQSEMSSPCICRVALQVRES